MIWQDIAEFRAELLVSWKSSTTDQIIHDLDDQAPPDRLALLFKRAFGDDLGLEVAIRSWALNDHVVANVVAKVDERRVSYIASLLIAVGVDKGLANARAVFIYWAYLGQGGTTQGSDAAIAPDVIENIAEIFES